MRIAYDVIRLLLQHILKTVTSRKFAYYAILLASQKDSEIYLLANRHVSKKSFKKNNFVRRTRVLSNCFIRLYNSGFKSFTWNSGSDIIWSSNLYEKFDTGYLQRIKKKHKDQDALSTVFKKTFLRTVSTC